MVKYPQAVLIWTLIIPLAVLNGGLREHVLAPAIGNAALPVSGLILSLCIAVAAFLLVPKIKNLRKKDGIVFGVLWFCLTNLFDLSMYISAGGGFSDLLGSYDFTGGNLWALVVLTALLAPAAAVNAAVRKQ